MERRRYLLGLTSATAWLAGCSTETGGSPTGTTESDGGGTADGDEETTESGEETDGETADTAQSTGGLGVVHAAGTTSTTGVTAVNLLVTPQSADGLVGVNDVTVEWVGPGGPRSIGYGDDGDASFSVETVQDENDSLDSASPTLDAPADHANLVIPAADLPGGPLEAGSSATLTITVAGSDDTRLGLAVPDTLTGSALSLATASGVGGSENRSRLQVSRKVGETADDAVGTVRIGVGVGPERPAVDLGQTVLRYLDSSGVYDLTHTGGTAGAETFATAGVRDENGSPPVLDAGDRADLTLDLSAVRGDAGLPAGAAASVYLVTPSGGVTTAFLFAPDALPEGESVSL